MQALLAPHALLHAPQFDGSVWRSAQTVPHSFVGAPHPQTPAPHGTPLGQIVPHAPQLFASVRASTHVPPQKVKPGGQPHTPSSQMRPRPQMLWHTPQLPLSVEGSMHAPAHERRPEPHPPSGLRFASLRASCGGSDASPCGTPPSGVTVIATVACPPHDARTPQSAAKTSTERYDSSPSRPFMWAPFS
jgi:hypothetical protein